MREDIAGHGAHGGFDGELAHYKKDQGRKEARKEGVLVWDEVVNRRREVKPKGSRRRG